MTFLRFFEHCIKVNRFELAALVDEERALLNSLSRDELELHGVAIFNLRVVPGSWSLNQELGSFSFKVIRPDNASRVGFAKTK